MNLYEAFEELQQLTEETLDVTIDGIAELEDIVNEPKETSPIEVIDAEMTDELDSTAHVGQVVIECDTCKSLFYKEPFDIYEDENTDLVNMDEECLVCGATNGFNVIGKITEYEPAAEEEETSEEEEVEETEDETDVVADGEEEVAEEEETTVVEESLTEAFTRSDDSYDDLIRYIGCTPVEQIRDSVTSRTPSSSVGAIIKRVNDNIRVVNDVRSMLGEYIDEAKELINDLTDPRKFAARESVELKEDVKQELSCVVRYDLDLEGDLDGEEYHGIDFSDPQNIIDDEARAIISDALGDAIEGVLSEQGVKLVLVLEDVIKLDKVKITFKLDGEIQNPSKVTRALRTMEDTEIDFDWGKVIIEDIMSIGK